MMTDIKLVKELLYRTEDIFALGCTMPLVAFSQLNVQYEKLKQTMDENDDAGLASTVTEVKSFIQKNQEDFNDKDERALLKAFLKINKTKIDRLERYRRYHRYIKVLEETKILSE